MSDHVFEKIGSIKRIAQDGPQNIVELNKAVAPLDHSPPDRAYFDSLMNKEVGENIAVEKVSKDKNALSQNHSFIDEVSQLNGRIETSGFSSQDIGSKIRNIREKTQDSIETIGNVRQKLNSPEVRLRNSFQSPLRNKLLAVRENLEVVSKTAGIRDLRRMEALDLAAEGFENPLDKLPKPMRKFFNLLTEGQIQLEELDRHLSFMGSKELSPTELLTIQVKMGHISHELELFSSLLNKAIESTKTIMNVQV